MRKNAKLYRIALRGLLAALALGGLQVAHAGYAQLATPSGFGGTAGNWTYAAAANDKVYGKVIHQAGALTANVGGQAVKMPAAYRLAANAPRIAAAAVYLHPGVRTAVTVAGWLVAAKLVWDEASQSWKSQGNDGSTTSHGYEYRAHSPGALWRPTAELACKDWLNVLSQTWAGSYVYKSSVPMSDGTCALAWQSVEGGNSGTEYQGYEIKFSQCPTGWTATPAGCLSPALTQPQFEEELIKAPMPSSVPLELPYPTPLPIEQPSPWINPTPGENPQSQPLRVPTGQPVPIPNTDPQQYRHPYVDIVPAPTPDNPWRVDVKPGETISTNPNPAENPQPDPQEEPGEEEDKSLCEKYPDILACSKPELDVPDGEIPKLTKQITYAEEGGFGGGSCPSNVYANLHGKQTMVYEWTRTCSVVSTYIRPIMLLLGAMGALFILIPGRDS